jgi:hypothetical protein
VIKLGQSQKHISLLVMKSTINNHYNPLVINLDIINTHRLSKKSKNWNWYITYFLIWNSQRTPDLFSILSWSFWNNHDKQLFDFYFISQITGTDGSLISKWACSGGFWALAYPWADWP